MFVDASALVAIVLREAGAVDLGRRYLASDSRLTSPIAIYEAALAIARVGDGDLEKARSLLLRLFARTGVEVVSVGPREAEIALDAHARFGKGRHPARLNMGDCFAYACARIHAVPLLYKGDDFALTDIKAA